MRRLVGLLFALLIVSFGLSFALLNAEPVALDYYLGATTLPLSLALTLSFVLGAALGLLAAAAVLVQQRRQISRLRRRLEYAEREVDQLRKLPLRAPA